MESSIFLSRSPVTVKFKQCDRSRSCQLPTENGTSTTAQFTSFGPNGSIGYPYQPEEIKHFIAMLRETRQSLSDDDLAKIEADLNAYREDREKKVSSR